MSDQETLEAQYRVVDEGPEAPWRDGEPVFQEGGVGNLMVFLLVLVGGPFIFQAFYRWFAAAM